MTTPAVPERVALSQSEIDWKTAQKLARTVFVPKKFQAQPESVFAAILWGRQFGWGEIQSVNSIDVIEGKPTLTAEAQRTLIRQRGHRIRTVTYTETEVTLEGTRFDTGEVEKVTWTIEMARTAGLLGKDNWKHYPRAMLLARATTDLANLLFSDVVAGSRHTAEELGADRPPETDVIDVDEVAPDVGEDPVPVDVTEQPSRGAERLPGPQPDRLPLCEDDDPERPFE